MANDGMHDEGAIPLIDEDDPSWNWRCQVPFACTDVEGMPHELAAYLGHLRRVLQHGTWIEACLQIEPWWDGCSGRWGLVELTPTEVRSQICAAPWLEPHVIDAPVWPRRAEPILLGSAWELHDGDHWHRRHQWADDDELTVARTLLAPMHAVFGVDEPRRWTIAIGLCDRSDSRHQVDVRRWAEQLGLPTPPLELAPAPSEPWALLCDAGQHLLHEPPCFHA